MSAAGGTSATLLLLPLRVGAALSTTTGCASAVCTSASVLLLLLRSGAPFVSAAVAFAAGSSVSRLCSAAPRCPARGEGRACQGRLRQQEG
jgi:hypothetical protein